MSIFCIMNGEEESDDNYGLFWSNEDGWGDFKSCDTFTAEEVEKYDLPMEGEWVRVSVVEAIRKGLENE